MPVRVALIVSGADWVIDFASSIARDSTWLWSSRSSVINPANFAFSASISCAVNRIWAVRASPIKAMKRFRLAIARQLPNVLAIGTPTFTERLPMRREQDAAMAAPPPVTKPFSAAIVGTSQYSISCRTASIICS